MNDDHVSQKVEQLGDIELAMLLSLTAKQHCIIHVDEEATDSAESEIRLVR